MATKNQKRGEKTSHRADPRPQDRPQPAQDAGRHAERSDRDDGPAVQEHERVVPLGGRQPEDKKSVVNPDAGQ